MNKFRIFSQIVFVSAVMLIIIIAFLTTQSSSNAKATINNKSVANLPSDSSLFTNDYLLWSASGAEMIQAIPISTVHNFALNFQQGESFAAGDGAGYIVLAKDDTRAFVTNYEANTLSIVNLISKTLETTITVGLHPHDIVLSTDETYAYVINQGMIEDTIGSRISQTVSIVNLGTKLEEVQIRLGAPPDNPFLYPDASTLPQAIELSEDEKTAYVADFETSGIVTVDLVNRKVSDRIDIGVLGTGYSRPVEIVRSKEFGIAYVAGGFYSTLFGIEDWWLMIYDLETKQPLRKIVLNYTGRGACASGDVDCPRINPRGLSLSPDGSTAYLVAYSWGRLLAVDLSSEKLIWDVPVGDFPEHMTLSKDGKKAYVVNSSNNSVSIVDLNARVLLATITIDAKPYAITASSTKGFITSSQSDSITAIDLNQPTLTDQIFDVTVGRVPKDIHLSPDNRYAYVSNIQSNNLSVVDLVTKQEVNKIETQATSHQFALSTDGRFAYLPHWSTLDIFCQAEGALHIYNLETRQLVNSLPTDECPFAAIPVGNTIYSTSFGKDQLAIIDSSTQTITGRIRTGLDPGYFVVTKDAKRAYVANVESDSISILDLESKTRIGNIAIGDGPRTIELSKDESKAYVPNFNSGTLSIVDLVEKTELRSIKVGKGAFGVALSPDEKFAYVTAYESSSIYVVDLTLLKTILTIPTGREPLIIRYVTPPDPNVTPQPTATLPPSDMDKVYLPLVQH